MEPQDKELDEELFQIIENADWKFIGRNSAEYCEVKDKLLLYRNKYAQKYADKIIGVNEKCLDCSSRNQLRSEQRKLNDELKGEMR